MTLNRGSLDYMANTLTPLPCFVTLFLKLFVWVALSGPCDLARDCKNNAACTGNADGSVTCKCRTEDECPKDGDGVCGSDGQTYLNKCLLDVAACANNKEVDVRHTGPCGESLTEL